MCENRIGNIQFCSNLPFINLSLCKGPMFKQWSELIYFEVSHLILSIENGSKKGHYKEIFPIIIWIQIYIIKRERHIVYWCLNHQILLCLNNGKSKTPSLQFQIEFTQKTSPRMVQFQFQGRVRHKSRHRVPRERPTTLLR